MEPMAKLTLKEFNTLVELFYTGKENIGYRLTYKGETLFEGEDFRPSPLYDQNSLKSIVSLLGFLTLKPGDTDAVYFAKYTEKQMDFATCDDAENINCYVGDFEYTDSENEDFHQNAVDYFTNRYETC